MTSLTVIHRLSVNLRGIVSHFERDYATPTPSRNTGKASGQAPHFPRPRCRPYLPSPESLTPGEWGPSIHPREFPAHNISYVTDRPSPTPLRHATRGLPSRPAPAPAVICDVRIHSFCVWLVW